MEPFGMFVLWATFMVCSTYPTETLGPPQPPGLAASVKPSTQPMPNWLVGCKQLNEFFQPARTGANDAGQK